MTMSRIRATGAAFIAATLVGWVSQAQGLTILSPEYLAPTYRPAVVHEAADAGGLPVDVHGGTAGAQLVERTVAAMSDSRLGDVAPLVSGSPEGTAQPAKLVVVFDPAPETGYEDVCNGTGPKGGDSVDDVIVTLCRDGAAMSSVTASNGDATGTDSAGFTDMMSRVATAVYPQRSGYTTGQGFWNATQRN